ncbi:MAG TPA: hypothetical protein VGM76_01610 [Lacipirellulaceae bacterium]|jgi:hypothetical protein
MSEDSSELTFGDEELSGHPQPEDTVSALSWSALDEQVTEDEIRLLDTLLLSDEAARETYLDCVRLHTDLLFHFREQEQPASAAAKSHVLGFLNESVPPLGAQPNANELRS